MGLLDVLTNVLFHDIIITKINKKTFLKNVLTNELYSDIIQLTTKNDIDF